MRRKGKVAKAMEFAEIIKKIQGEVRVVLKKVQEKIKKQANRERKKAEKWKKSDKVILSMKDLIFEEQLAKNLIEDM